MTWSRRSIRTQLVVLVLALAVPLTAFAAYSIVAEYQVGIRRAEESALAVADATAASVTQFLTDIHVSLERLADGIAHGRLPLDDCDSWLGEATHLMPFLTNLIVLDRAGSLVCSALPADLGPNRLATDREYFRDVLRTRRFTVGEPIRGRISDAWVSVLAHPVLDDHGQVSAVVGLAVNLVRYQQSLAGLRLPPGAVITIAHRDGTVVARSEGFEEWVGRLLPTSGSNILGADAGITRTRGVEGTARVWGFTHVSGAPWIVFAGLPEAWIYGPIRQTAITRVLLALSTLLFVGALAVRFHGRIARGLQALVEGAERGTPPSEVGSDAPEEVVQVAHRIHRAIAARDAAQVELRKTEERHHSLLENAVFGIYMSTLDGQFLEVNSTLVDMLGYESAEELLATGLSDLYADSSDRERLVRRYRDAQKIDGVEVEWRAKSGSTIWVELNGSPVSDEEGETRFEMIVEDVTTKRQLERQLRHSQKMQAMGRLAGGIAHDFNNILTVINGRAQLLAADLADRPDLSEDVEQVIAAAARAAALTRQLLAFSRRQAGRPKTLDINELIRGMGRMLEPVIGRDIQVLTRLTADLAPVYADPAQIEQVIMNLVINARDAMPDGGTITIETTNRTIDGQVSESHQRFEPGRYVSIAVSDTGCGMDPSIRALVFEPFFTTKPEGKGTGLGLSTAYGIVAQAGGGISVKSAVAEGTTFTVLLPLARDTEPEPDDAFVEPTDLSGDATVLIVDDDSPVRALLAEVLAKQGYTVLQAGSGAETLDLAEHYTGPIHLLLTDVIMPGMPGTTLADRLTETRPDLLVLYMSGHVDDDRVREEVFDRPATFIAKPFTPEEIATRVRQALGDVAPTSRSSP